MIMHLRRGVIRDWPSKIVYVGPQRAHARLQALAGHPTERPAVIVIWKAEDITGPYRFVRLEQPWRAKRFRSLPGSRFHSLNPRHSRRLPEVRRSQPAIRSAGRSRRTASRWLDPPLRTGRETEILRGMTAA